ncbi:hypothetical protein Taro_036307 [Colocasia esculenta]|uniref:Uncharacterized protein n=1 Tax=Colocasia esculenta TaxID=4460 RepID=A0A843W9C0_COLES|nr:hypothetical protein [Colocasia esculenta]
MGLLAPRRCGQKNRKKRKKEEEQKGEKEALARATEALRSSEECGGDACSSRSSSPLWRTIPSSSSALRRRPLDSEYCLIRFQFLAVRLIFLGGGGICSLCRRWRTQIGAVRILRSAPAGAWFRSNSDRK